MFWYGNWLTSLFSKRIVTASSSWCIHHVPISFQYFFLAPQIEDFLINYIYVILIYPILTFSYLLLIVYVIPYRVSIFFSDILHENYIIFQKLINLLFCGRTSFHIILKSSCTVPYSQLPCFSVISLSNADFILQLFQKPFFFQSPKSRKKITIAGAARLYFLYCITNLYDFLVSEYILPVLAYSAHEAVHAPNLPSPAPKASAILYTVLLPPHTP